MAVDVARDVFDVVGFIGLPQQQRCRAMRLGALLREEMRVPGGDDPIGQEEPGVAVVGVQAPAAPGIVAEDHVGTDPADGEGHLPTLPKARLEFAVGPSEKGHIAPCRRVGGTPRVAPAGDRRPDGPYRSLGSQEPLDPSVHTRWWMRHPARRPLGQRGAASELDIVRMGADRQGHAGEWEVRRWARSSDDR